MLRHPPLRTERASFPALGSSLNKRLQLSTPVTSRQGRCLRDLRLQFPDIPVHSSPLLVVLEYPVCGERRCSSIFIELHTHLLPSRSKIPKRRCNSPMGGSQIPIGINQQDSASLTRLETSQKSALFRAGHSCVPYLPHYRAAFAFSAILYPPLQQFPLRLTCPCGRRVGLTVFHSNNTSG